MNNKSYIYFDCSATTKPYPEVIDTFDKVSLTDFANASSTHALGYQANNLLGKARSQVAKYLGVLEEEVIFTSGATEGNNLSIKGVCYHNKSWANRIITTKAEHPSVLEVFKELEKEGYEVIYLDYDKEGRLDLNELKKSLNDKTSLVSVMAVNNETGYIFPIREVYELVHANSKALLHVDATQAICKEEVDPSYYDLMTFSGHKIGGLKGSGVLVKKKNAILEDLMIGGGQEFNLRSGTTPLGLDCSLATALRLSFKSLPTRKKQATLINQYLRTELSKIKEVVIISPLDATPFILNFALTLHKGSVIAEALSNNNIYVSTKSACSSHEPGISYVLKNAGYDDNISHNSIRLSFSGLEDLEEAKTFMTVLKKCLADIKVKD